MKKVILVLLFLFFGLEAWADDVDLSRIVVTASRTEEEQDGIARNIDVISAKDIQNSQAKDISQVLTQLSSVNISDYGGVGATKTIRMRGSSAAQVLVMVDGRPLNSPRDGQAELAGIPLDNIERIEVMHGPASSLYGAGAMGGTVNIITKNPPKEKQKTEIYTGFGSFRTYTEQLSHGAAIGPFGYLISAGLQDSEGCRDNSEFNARDFNAKLEYEINSSNSVGFNSGFYKSTQGAPGSTVYFDADDKQTSVKNYFDINWQSDLDNIADISTRVYQNYDRLTFLENTAGSFFDVEGKKDVHTTKTRGFDLQLTRQLTGFYQAVGGFNYVGNFNKSTTSGKHKYNLRAGYLENKFKFFEDNFRVNLGARVDDYSNFGSEFNPSLSLLYIFNANLKLHGLVSRSFRAPTFNDLYWPDEGWARGNPNLKPEKGLTEEIGFEADFNKYFSTGLTYYRNDFDDLINWQDEAGVWMPKNVGKALIQGIEFQNKINFTDRLALRLNYTYLEAKDKRSHKYLVYQPKHKTDCIITYKDLNGFSCELKGQFTDRRFYDEANTVYIKKFWVFSVNVSKRFNPAFTCYVSMDNLFDRKYKVIQNYPMPGFSFTGGIKLEF